MTNTSSSAHAAFGPDRLLVKAAARPDFSSVEQMPRGAERKRAAWAAITASAEAALPPLTKLADQLKEQGFLTNVSTLVSPAMLVLDVADGKAQSVLAAFRNTAVAAIYDGENGRQVWPAVRQALDGAGAIGAPSWGLDVVPQSRPAAAPTDMPYGVQLMGAPAAWAAGADGRGMVFGSIDTGADASHPAISRSYRGTLADGSQQHDYNWMDFAKRPSAAPKDYQGHGTHTIGSVTGMAGDTPIGVAPGATWIAAHGLTGRTTDILRALQWMQAPTRGDGSAPDASKAPDVVGMSWWTGSPRESLLHESILNLRAAGIEPVKSAGNQGPDPRTITSPGQFPELFATAAVDRNGRAARFSSRGPAPFPAGSTTPKPDFAAPGVDVLSSLPGGKYGAMSGTSMAQPHMSGAILALLSKFPQLTHRQLEQALATGALDAGTPGRDDVYGWGIVRLPQAIEAAAAITAKPARTAA
jgi:subtilisin family serine protease